MDYNRHYNRIFLSTLILIGLVIVGSYLLVVRQFIFASIILFIAGIIGFYIARNLTSHLRLVSDFFDAIKYKDFTRFYDIHTSNSDTNDLHIRFNELTNILRAMNTDRVTHNIYLTRILEMIQTGILAFDESSGEIVWINDTFTKMLDIPSIKNINFLEKRRHDLFVLITGELNLTGSNITLDIQGQKQIVLLSVTAFEAEKQSFRLVVLQNIDDTHNQIESDAWKKLLSVMTHEIMNSIAPIASLTETLQAQIRSNLNEESELDMNDLDAGLETIHRRSEGLMKFAQTYRSLSKVTQIHASNIKIKDLFDGMKQLMQTELLAKGVDFSLTVEPPDLSVEVDTYLIEQVLINLILNAADAVKEQKVGAIRISASRNIEGITTMKVSDNGKGISDEVLENIFIPFFTTKKNGSGIGLSLSKQIMLLHKGKILVNSILEKGTVVSLVFPSNSKNDL